MSPAAVEIRSPIENRSSWKNPNSNFTPFVSNDGHFEDRQSMDPSSSSSPSGLGIGAEFRFGAASDSGSGSQTTSRFSGRMKPRLVKLRKSLHSGRARSTASCGNESGFNPFASLGVVSDGTSNTSSSIGFSSGRFDVNEVNNGNDVSNGSASFVFGANGSDSAVSLCSVETGLGSDDETVKKKDSDSASPEVRYDRNNLSSDVDFEKDETSRRIGGSGSDTKWGKRDSICDNLEMPSGNEFHSVPAAVNGYGSLKKGVFEFGNSDKEPSKTSESQISSAAGQKCENPYDMAAKYGPEDVFGLPDEMRKLNMNDSKNVRVSETSEKSSEVNGKPVFVFSSCQKVNMHQNGAATACGSFLFTPNSSQQNDSVVKEQSSSRVENNSGSSSTGATDGTGAAFTEFKMPQWDPSLLKENLFPEVGRKGEFIRRSRLSKDKRSKKGKEKLKQSGHVKQNLSQDHISTESDSQEKTNSPEYYSPMEFSPYEDDKTAGELPTETPMPSSEPSGLNNYANAYSSSRINVVSAGDGYAFGTEEEGSNSTRCFPFGSGFEDVKSFAFSASSASQGNLSLRKHHTQKKTRKKVNNCLSRKNQSAMVFSPTSAAQGQTEESSRSKPGNKSEKVVQINDGSSFTSVIPDACEMWRLRGNQAYRNGDLLKAEDCYTQGISSVPSGETSGCYVKPLALCYSNRAATRISLGRLREALGDCTMAASLDPNFLKVYIRAANCHLVLGEVEEAFQFFNKCVELSSSICLDRRTTIEAAEGLQKAQRVAKCTNHSRELLETKTSDAALNALDIISEALSIGSCSEKLLHMKAEALFMVRRYKEVIELCEHTLHIADKNSASAGAVDCLTETHTSESENQSLARLWRWYMMSKSYFYMGKLETALDLLQKLQQLGSTLKHKNDILESSNSLASTISELLQCKNAGNKAVRTGRYAEAVEHYTVALSKNVESRPFAAVCFCNRAAANQALNQIVDAIADCSLAMALDGNYTKAVSRRATLHEMIRDYGQAASDLQRLISILEKQSDEGPKTPNTSGGHASIKKEIRQTRQRLSLMEEEATRGVSLDLYLILGIRTSDTAADIKKAYRKAALKHHPDKAGQSLVRSDSGDEGRLWKEIVEEVHKDADRVFKMIGEAYAVLSDPAKRSEYDIDEEMRKARASRESNRNSGRRKPSDVSSYPCERSPNGRNWRETRNTYRSSNYWW